MWLTAAAIRRPLLVSMAILALVVLGWRAYQDLTVELYPKVDFPIVTVTTVYPGADPAEVETEVTKPIEENVSTIANVNHVTSRSLQNYSIVTIEFELGTNLDDAVAALSLHFLGGRVSPTLSLQGFLKFGRQVLQPFGLFGHF
ncbi:MAG: hypothetical protein BDTLLHRC_001075 [Candidatus Fervidibacter sp.]